MAQNTNLNIAPYFDDFDSDKGFLKVLFKPGYPVQARELTTLQSVLQNQIDTFGQGVYKEGSMVVPGGITLNKDVKCIIIQNNYLNLDVELYRSQLDGKIIKGSTSGVRARILFSISSATSTKGNITFYVNYLQKADDNDTTTFTDGETFTCEDDITYQSTTIASGSPLAQLLNSGANSIGSTANIGRGVYYVRGYFVTVAEQTLILDQYDITPSYKVGLKVEERIVTADEDESLYDNAIGSTNFSAPGADRFKIILTLVKKEITDPNSADFIELLRTNAGSLEKKVARSDLGFIKDVLATRTQEESGDYYVKKFEVDVRENLSDTFNNGVYTSDQTTAQGAEPSEANMAVQLSSGTAYISGYRTERLSTTYTDVEKPREFLGADNQSISSTIGNYITVTNAYQAPSLYSNILLRDELTSTPGTAVGTVIGIAKVLNFSTDSGSVNTATTRYRINIAQAEVFVKLVTTASTTWTQGNYVTGTTSGATGFVYSGSGTTGYVYGVNGKFQNGEAIKVAGQSRTLASSGGAFEYSFGDVKSYSDGAGFTADAVLGQRVSLPGSGPIISGHSGGNATVTATLSNFASQLRVGDIIEFSNNNAAHKAKVTGVTSNFVFTITRLGSTTLTNGAITSAIIRTRTGIQDAQNRKLLTNLGYGAVKSTNKANTVNPAGYYRKSYTNLSVSGGSVTVDAGSGLVFRDAGDGDDFTVIINAGTGAGGIVEEGSGFSISGSQANVQQINVTGLSGVTNIDVIATVYKSDRSAKAKTTERMKILKLDKSFAASANGLTQQTGGFGNRVDDSRISLGCGDAFKIKAIYESTNANDPVLPQFSYTNLVGSIATDDVITGDTSESRARVIATSSNTVFFIPVEGEKFTDGETITGPNATFKIQAGTINTAGVKDITDEFDFVDGQKDQFYDYSSINRKSGFAAPTHRVFVIFDRFLTTSGESFYSVDSYSTDDYKIIPEYDNEELRNVLDFRPIVAETLSGSGSISTPYTLSTTKSFDLLNRSFSGNQVGLPGQGDTTILSLQYYLGRVDKVFLNKDNVVQIVKGAPAATPIEPEDIDDAMLLATLTMKPYVFDVDEDVQIKETNYRRYTFRDIQKLDDRIKTLEYYTQLSLLEGETASMEIRDASGLSRFKNGFIVDNFASLSTSDTLHPDYRVSVDFEEGQLRPPHYTTLVDLVPSSASTNIQTTGDIVTLPYTDQLLVDQPYASAVENVNPFNVFTYTGDVKLYPESDNWVDTKSLSPLKLPVIEGNFLTTVREYNADQNGFSPIHWNAWKTTWTGTKTTESTGKWRRDGGKGRRRERRTITTTTTTTTKQTRTGIRYRVTPVIEQQSLGSRVVSVEHIQFMRSRNIQVKVQKLKPRTRFYPFFDGIKIPAKLMTPRIMGVVKNPSADSKTNNIPFQVGETVLGKVTKSAKATFRAKVAAPNENFTINPLTGDDISSVNDYTANLGFINIDTRSLADQAKGSFYGSPKQNFYLIGQTSGAVAKVSDKRLITDQRGNLDASFFIPNPKGTGSLKFKTGTRLLKLTDDKNDSGIQGVSDSSGEAEFTASGILQTTQETMQSVRNAKVTSENQKQSRTLVNSTSSSREETRWHDPLAQTFLIEDSNLEGGVYLSKIDLFFFQKDSEIPVVVDIRTVENGIPTQDILPFSKVVKQPEDVTISTNASTPTTFTFESPVFLPFRKEHAFVVTSDSNQYKVFISVLGQDAVDAAHSGEKISEQPYIGVLFKSQNASTWTPSQYEDLMFKIYRCKFTQPTTAANSKLILENAQLKETNGGTLALAPNALQFTSGSADIRVFHSNHGMQSNLNYARLEGVVSEVPATAINANSGLSTTGTSITVDDASQFHTTIGGSAVSNSNPGFIRILGDDEDGSGDEIIAYSGISGNVITIATNGRNHDGTSGSSTGKAHDDDAVVECYNIAGIPLPLVNTTHNSTTGGIISINSPHSYKLRITGKNAGKTINAGGANMEVTQNIPWDVLTPQIQSQTQPNTSITARVLGTSGTSCGPFPSGVTAETSFVKDTTYVDVTLGEENYFPTTKVIAHELNEQNRMNNAKSFTLELDLQSENDHLSPVIDLTRCSIITTANVYNNIEPSAGVGGECAANYITKVARLANAATSLKVMLSANTWTPSNIRVMYKLVPVGSTASLDDLQFQFFNTDGRADSGVLVPQNEIETFTDYEFSVEDVEEFDAFQIKIAFIGYDQPYIPRVKDFRGIALA